MSDWIKTDRAMYQREKISGVRIYNTMGIRHEYRIEVLIEGGWRRYYEGEEVSSRDKSGVETECAKAWEIYRKLCAELE